MSVLKNRMSIWQTYHKSVYYQYKHMTTKSSASSLVPTYSVFLQLKRNIGHIIPLCSSSSQNCLRPRLSRLLRSSPFMLVRPISLSSHQTMASSPLTKGTDNLERDKLLSEMNIRLVNENNFLSWCRNAYLSSVVGVAMITEGTTLLAQNAGVGALVVGTMNLFWGTACHITNLIRMRHVVGMSGFTMALNVLGSILHCLLWIFVLICYIGFLDETRTIEQHQREEINKDSGTNLRDNEV